MSAALQPLPADAREARRRQFQQISDLAQAMLDKARAGEWAAVAEMEARRQALIKAFFEHTPHPDEKAWLAEAIRAVLEVDRTMIHLGRDSLGELTAQLETLRQGQRATRAYGCVEPT